MRGSGQLRLGDEIGRGALGRVVRVHGDSSTEPRAGKILHASHQGDPDARERFANEANVLRDLDHPNIVRIDGLETIDGEDVLVMEYIEGASLAEIIACHAPLREARIIALARGLAAGLAVAHHAGLIHRDLKPANVLVSAGDAAKIVDFGMARATSLEGIDRSAVAIVGTPDYMAPESVQPLAVDTRSDIYALGCILFEMAAGHPPYAAATAFACLRAHRTAPIPELDAGLEASERLRELIRWCLAKSPADRPQSAAVVERELVELGGRAGAETALVRHRTGVDVGDSGACAECGAQLVVGVAVCFGCGLEQGGLEPGPMSVFVVGPGKLVSKLDTKLRQNLLDWLRANPALGLDPVLLAKKVPRLPFVMAIGVSEPAARRLVSSLERLGLECAVERGGRFALRDARKKAAEVGWRITAATLCSTAVVFAIGGILAAPLGIVAMIGSHTAGWYLAGRRFAKQRTVEHHRAPLLRAPLDRVAAVVPTLDARRHRDSLRSVVQRVLALRAYLGDRGDASLDEDLARIVDLAVVASTRIDELELALSEADLSDPRDEVRARLRERDTWAARLLEAAAFLDSLRARYAAASDAKADPGESAAALDELRHHVAALQEVQAL